MPTIGGLWWLIVLSVIVVLAIWYWTTAASHRVVERISKEDPRRYNFKFREQEKRKERK